MTIKIYRDCERCNGVGEIFAIVHGGNSRECPDCEGTGKMLFADSSDLETKLNDMSDKLDTIKDVVDAILAQVS